MRREPKVPDRPSQEPPIIPAVPEASEPMPTLDMDVRLERDENDLRKVRADLGEADLKAFERMGADERAALSPERLLALAEAGERAEIARGGAHHREDLYGAFADGRRPDGQIVLGGEASQAVETAAAKFRSGAKYMTNTITGEKIAAEYDIRTNNFSTQTRIDTLPDGRKVFIVYDHRGSWMHRALDGVMKRLNGLRMRKVSRKDWKTQFESKSTIPTIANTDPDTVVMPFIPNVNAHDVFVKNADIEDFGACGWAKQAGEAEKLDMAASLVDEVKRFHAQGKHWGELILPNVIFSEDKKPIVCDPEIRYDDDIPPAEAKARDLKDLCLSVAAALEQAHGTDVGKTVGAILDRYGDSEAVAELKKLAAKKRGIFQGLAFGYEQVRTGTKGKKQYDAILAAIVRHGEKA